MAAPKFLSQLLVSLYVLVCVAWSLAPDYAASSSNGEKVARPRGRRQVFNKAVERDAHNRPTGPKRGEAGIISRDATPPGEDTLIGKLWDENEDLVQKFLNVEFLRFQAEHPQNETLASYQYYSVQDYYYLVDYVQFKALRMSTYPEFNATELLALMTAEAASVADSTGDAWGFRNETLIGDLGIPPRLIDDGLRAGAEIAYADWLQKNVDLGWFTLHVMTIPCVYGWSQLATKLYNSNTTLPNTTFYNTWILPNKDYVPTSLINFLEDYKAEYNSFEAYRTWTAVFRQALQFEIDLFNGALGQSLDTLQLAP